MRKILAVIVFLALSLFAAGAGRTYYVSGTGEDRNDGLSPERAWKSLAMVNGAALRPGDRVLFRCGDVFRGQLRPSSGEISAPVGYGSYGE